MSTQFEVGDKVRAWGVDGVVIGVSSYADEVYPIGVRFDGTNSIQDFTDEGRYQSWHKEPSLFLVEKAKKDEPIVQWYSVIAMRKSEPYPVIYHGPYKDEEDFLETIRADKDNFHCIKLIPVCKTQGNKFVEE